MVSLYTPENNAITQQFETKTNMHNVAAVAAVAAVASNLSHMTHRVLLSSDSEIRTNQDSINNQTLRSQGNPIPK
jgi:hypothetical protein